MAPSIDVNYDCVDTLTVTGLEGSTTADDALDLTGASDTAVFGSSGTWTRDGTLIVSVIANFAQSTAVTLEFTLQNRPETQVAQDVTLISPSVFPTTSLSGTNIMKIDALLFDSPVGQESTQSPCALNTITIRLPLSVPLLNTCLQTSDLVAYGRFPTLTLTGFFGARSSSITQVSSTYPAFNEVVPTFDHENGIIELAPSQATTAATDYVFSFEIRNGAVETYTGVDSNYVPSLFVETDILSHSATSIGPGGVLHVLQIERPEVLGGSLTSVRQSSDNPCAQNTITVSLQTNVPIFAWCAPSIVLSGLQNTSTPSSSSSVPVPVKKTGSSDALRIDSWVRQTGLMALSITSDVGADATSKSLVLMFDVTNPSMSQQPVGVGLQLSYSDGEGENKIWHDNAITELIFDTNVDGVPGQTQNVEDYPMYVAGATLDSAIAQSTPSPCVENTITVTISCTVDLLAGCMPLFSLTGVTGSTTEDTLLLSVEYSSGASAWSLSGSWSKDSGALGVSLFAQDSADDTSIAANTDIVLSFKIFNPSSSQLTAPTTSLSLTLDDRIPDTDGYQTSFHDAEIHTSSTMTRPTDSNLFAMYVREVAISSTSVQQSNTYPCSENIITVAFTVSAQVAFFCANTITISGLVGVNDDPNVALQQYSSVFSPSADWNRVQEELVVTLVANLAGSTQYSFSVVLKNGPLWQSASAANLTEPAIIGSTVELNGAVNVIDRFAPSIATISASSTEPCGPNVITISFVPNIDVKASCDSPQENGEVQTGPVYLYIYGLTGSSTSSQALAVTPNVAGVFSNQGNWEKDVGSMRLYLQAGLTKDTEYELSFTILNGAFEFAGHNNINLTLPGLSASVVLDGTALQVDSFYITPDVSSSSNQPCALSTITVIFTPSLPFAVRQLCSPRFTLRGLTGTTTRGDAETRNGYSGYTLSVENPSPATGGWSSLLTWNMEEGKAIIELVGDLEDLSAYEFSFTVRNGPEEQLAKYVYLGDHTTLENNRATASPTMAISAVDFTQKSIAQSTPYPCATNTITVTIATSVGLLNTCGDADGIGNGVYPLITISGLDGSRDSLVGGSRLTSSTTSPFNSSATTLSSGSLEFSPLFDVVAGQSYVFSFTLTNQETGQAAAADIVIDIDTLTHASEDMVTDSGLLQPMYIMEPIVQGGSQTVVQQQTSHPCALNRISITITTNVPIFEICAPTLTLTGFTASSTTSLGAGELSMLGGTTSGPDISIVSWVRTTGTLVLDLPTIDQGTTDGTTTFSFTVDLRNPSKYQDAPGVDLILAYSDVWTNLATENGTNYVAEGNAGALFSSASVSYPFKISLLTVSSSFAQSSPYPCDNNTITVTFTPSHNLIPECLPQVSLAGMIGSSTSSGSLMVSPSNAGSAMQNKLAVWDTNAGSLVWSIFAAGESSEVTAGTDLVFTFELTNQPAQQSSPASTLTITLQDKPTDIDGYDSSFHDATTHNSALSVPGSVTGAVDPTGKDECGGRPASGDANPLRIRPVAITEFTVVQSTSNPCASNVITVSLTTDGPLFSSCVPALTLAGFVGSTTPDDASLGLTIAPSGALQTFGAWTNTLGSGKLVVPASSSGVLVGCRGYQIQFTLKNPAAPQEADDVTLSVDSVIGSPEVAGANSDQYQDPMKIVELTWTSPQVSGTSTYPCSDNIITLLFTPDIDVYADCTFLEFSGFTGSMTSESYLTISSPMGATFNTTSAWSMSSGTLRVYLADTLLSADTEYEISFTIRNGLVAQNVQDISIDAPQLSSNSWAWMDDQASDVMKILQPSWSVDITTSSTNPCMDSLVSISITPLVAPIRRDCDTKITVRGIKVLYVHSRTQRERETEREREKKNEREREREREREKDMRSHTLAHTHTHTHTRTRTHAHTHTHARTHRALPPQAPK